MRHWYGMLVHLLVPPFEYTVSVNKSERTILLLIYVPIRDTNGIVLAEHNRAQGKAFWVGPTSPTILTLALHYCAPCSNAIAIPPPPAPRCRHQIMNLRESVIYSIAPIVQIETGDLFRFNNLLCLVLLFHGLRFRTPFCHHLHLHPLGRSKLFVGLWLICLCTHYGIV